MKSRCGVTNDVSGRSPTDHREQEGRIKRKLRRLKKLEMKIRFGQGVFLESPAGLYARMNATSLVWDEMFDLHTKPLKNAKYTFSALCSMSQTDFDHVIEEFFVKVNYRFYKENGIVSTHCYDPDILLQLGLPYDADTQTVRKKIRELVKKVHPDAGGDHEQFIKLMETVDSLSADKKSRHF